MKLGRNNKLCKIVVTWENCFIILYDEEKKHFDQHWLVPCCLVVHLTMYFWLKRYVVGKSSVCKVGLTPLGYPIFILHFDIFFWTCFWTGFFVKTCIFLNRSSVCKDRPSSKKKCADETSSIPHSFDI